MAVKEVIDSGVLGEIVNIQVSKEIRLDGECFDVHVTDL